MSALASGWFSPPGDNVYDILLNNLSHFLSFVVMIIRSSSGRVSFTLAFSIPHSCKCPNLFNRKEYTSCHLEVDSSLHADAGQYKVTLENKLGTASGTINVKVIGKEVHMHRCSTSTPVSWILNCLCPQAFLVPAKTFWPRRSQSTLVKCPGILQTMMVAARLFTTSCRSFLKSLLRCLCCDSRNIRGFTASAEKIMPLMFVCAAA